MVRIVRKWAFRDYKTENLNSKRPESRRKITKETLII